MFLNIKDCEKQEMLQSSSLCNSTEIRGKKIRIQISQPQLTHLIQLDLTQLCNLKKFNAKHYNLI